MLLRFSVENFRSFGKEAEVNTLPYSKLRQHRNHLQTHGGIDLLKTTMLYGANGSGKSNFVHALYVLQRIIREGEIDNSLIDSFTLLNKFREQATQFSIEYAVDDQFYFYKIVIRHTTILSEELYRTDPVKGSDKVLYQRKYDAEQDQHRIQAAPELATDERERIMIEVFQKNLLEDDIALLHLIGNNEVFPGLKDAYRWFDERLHVIFPQSRYASLLESMLLDETFGAFINKVLPKLDTGLERLEIATQPLSQFILPDGMEVMKRVESELANKNNRFVGLFPLESNTPYLIERKDGQEPVVHRLVTIHRCDSGDTDFRLDQESDGTLRMLDLLPAIRHLISEECVFMVDEIGRSLHPLLLREFLGKYLNEATRGQLIFTTHDASLLTLDLFRRDEIWLVEKDDCGQSDFHSVSDYKIRHDLDIRKAYMDGRFGGVPALNGLRFQKWSDAET